MIRAPTEYTVARWPLREDETPTLGILSDVDLIRLLVTGGLSLATSVIFLDDLDRTRYRELSTEAWAWVDRAASRS